MAIKTVLLTRQPAEVAAFWDKLTGPVAPPCRLHPEYWLVRFGGMAIMDAAGREPGMYIRVNQEDAGWWSERHAEGSVERDDGGDIVAIILPDGQRMPVIEIDGIPKNHGEVEAIGMIQAVAARRERLLAAITAAGLANGRLIGPRNFIRARFRGTQPFRLVVDGDGDVAGIDAVLSEILVRKTSVVATLAADVPEGVRFAVDRLARYLVDDDAWEDQEGYW